MRAKITKVFRMIVVLSVVLVSANISVFADTATTLDAEIMASYERFCEYIDQHDILADVEYDVYAKGFWSSGYSSVAQYESVFKAQFNVGVASQTRSSSSGSGKYYYDTGTVCPANAVYSNATYNLLNTVKKGDLIFEDAGGPAGLTNHIAIVEGKFYDYSQGRFYIRLVEAIDKGVKRGILDDTRFSERQGTVLRISSASTVQKNNALSFAVDELGGSYWFDGAWDTSSAETDWYCSELAYAAYYNAGITLASGSFPTVPGVMPTDILNSSKTTSILTY